MPQQLGIRSSSPPGPSTGGPGAGNRWDTDRTCGDRLRARV